MKKFLLLLSVAFLGLSANAQQALKDNSLQKMRIERPAAAQPANRAIVRPTHQHRAGGRALGSILNSHRIGSSGNLLTIINGECNMLDVNNSLNAVTFIHRNDPTLTIGTNVAQYRFDVSKDRGLNWTSDIGPITVDPLIDNVNVNGRFPQAVLYNPAGNTNVDSAYLVYSGTWHNSPPSGGTGSWQGQMVGRGKLSGDVSTFNVSYPQINGGQVAIAAGMTKGAPGVFWNINQDYTGTFATGSSAITQGIIIEKGVWNTITKDVDWTEQIIPQSFTEIDNNGTMQTIAGSFNIAFDPTGQYGWASCVGDITPLADSVYQPIFWKTVDFGANWTGPFEVDLEQIQGLKATLNPFLVDGTTEASLNPTTSFQADLTVDVNGNPHLLVIVGSGVDYAIQAAGYGVWDITYDATAVTGCNWKGLHLADIFTLRGTFTNDNPAFTEDNRPLVSRSPDGRKIFFFWNETDSEFVQSTDNDIPNFFGRAIDVVDGKITQLYNFTEGDSLWGGETQNTAGGVFSGSTYPTVSPTCLVNGNIYNVPVVFTQIDYLNFVQGQLGSSVTPAAFWYVDNINFPASDFSSPLDQVPPTITLNGPDTVTVNLNTSYTELGATAFDCTDGVLAPSLSNSPDTSVVGIYNVTYIATDAAGNSDTVVRTVIVGTTPVANFTWSFPVNACRAQFSDQTINLPTSWLWNFGDNSGSSGKNPVHTFPGNGNYNVCLTSSNSFGTSTQICKQVTISGCVSTGVDNLDLAKQISMFPNPSTGKVFVSIEGNNLPDFTVTVYNILGETVVTPANYKAGTSRIEMDLSDVSSGVYLVKIQNNQSSVVKHLTVTHR